MKESEEIEQSLARAWGRGVYNEVSMRLVCEHQGLNFKNVQDLYAVEYEREQKEGALQWN